MRIFLSLLVLMALAACGGSSPTQKPISLKMNIKRLPRWGADTPDKMAPVLKEFLQK